MSERLRQTLIGFIWPGPIAGPLPVNLFRILAVLLVFYFGAFVATLLMGLITGLLSIFYFRLLELMGGREWVENLLRRLPAQTGERIKTRGPIALFASSLLVGVFPYAIFLKLLKYPEATSEILMILASFASSIVWTGVFWGTIVEILRQIASFAF